MTYTVQLDFIIDENVIRAKKDIENLVKEIFDYSDCYASNIKVLCVNDNDLK